METRLTRKDWIDHGLRTLATGGAGALKIGALATGLGVSRGSFYWHFRDFGDFRSGLLSVWRERTVDQIVLEFDAEKDAPHRLQRLVKRAFFGKRGLDRATRIWAADDPAVAAVVTDVDASRVEYMASLLVDGGLAAVDAQTRAAFIYWAYHGQAMVMDAALDEAAFERLIGLLEG